MVEITIEGKRVKLSPLLEILKQTGIERSALAPFEKDQAEENLVWQDAGFCEQLIKRLADSIPAGIDVDQLPQLPDQIAILLRNELTVASEKQPMPSGEKDRIEAQLQDVLRPVIYALIEQKLAKSSIQNPESFTSKVIEQTGQIGWQTVQVGEWDISEINSVLGGIGYRFATKDTVLWGARALLKETVFFIKLSVEMARKTQ